ncbi:VOC family protein [Microbacterium nymphoidis]|uniref:VOC family protein n=1 Tax=Microbacterium nymphoidis TaxID=2898586 RepID=UPI001E2E30D1|nr:VOC family protein [Microbacterium nymphoidis]MCD2499414.1 VOC family protein [Microbacterium nymphoidis]
MPITFESVMLRSPEPERAAAFWSALLHRETREDTEGILLPGSATQAGLRFASGRAHSALKNRVHLHLSRAARTQQQTIAAAERAGGRLLGSGNVPAGSYAVMADPAGDEFCVIEDENSYLAGCGPLGEVTCEGTRASGLFWSAVLGWPLVWDEGEETAIQSPEGGTKLAWSGDAVDPARDPSRQAFVLVCASPELATELARVEALGARVVDSSSATTTVLEDPEGVEFLLRSA